MLNVQTATTVPFTAFKEARYGPKPLLVSQQSNPTFFSNSSEARKQEGKLWDYSEKIPSWMKDYFSWHEGQRLSLNSTNYSSRRFLIMRCLRVDSRCGGAADRLLSIPFAVLLAYQSRRILLIKWERPAPLEFYLVPPRSGMDWRVPPWMERKLIFGENAMMRRHVQSKTAMKNASMVDMRDQSSDHGREYYNRYQKLGDAIYDEVFHDLWQTLFEPSSHVQSRLDQEMVKLRLTKYGYTAIHIRSTFSRVLIRSTNRRYLENSVRCGASLKPGQRLYIAADSVNASSIALQYALSTGQDAVARKNDQSPLHIDRGRDYISIGGSNDPVEHAPEAYLDTFVDLYLLAYGRCLAYTFGGYGRWANAISDHPACSIDHNAVDCGPSRAPA